MLSQPLQIQGIRATLKSAQILGLQPQDFAGAHLFVSPDGSAETFVLAQDHVGQPLQNGWRFKLELQSRLFDATAPDKVAVAYE